ncbi:helix-turn-helix transcriptional regulator [Nonomuraea sp. NPDC049129]|uniref:helix-turn-helix domain-containing protein n=1 Tax=Nonomuraea sp. NPDC049129 TaxID=3155272 RepID=UPI0033C60BBA
MTAPDGDWVAVGRAVRERRREIGIPTQRAAAERSGVSKNTWQRLEMGKPVSMTSLVDVAACLRWEESAPWALLRGDGAPVSEATPATDPNAWQALAAAVRSRRLELGFMTQKQAAGKAGIHVNTWNAVENDKPVKAASLSAIARVLRWHPARITAILRDGSLHADFKDAEPNAAPPSQPALLFITSNGTRCEIDRDVWDPLDLPARERALCRALLLHSLARLDELPANPGPSDPIEEAQ